MSQRSQIYIRYPKGKNKSDKIYGLIANDYRWNYAEKMVSRARWTIEHIRDNFFEATASLYYFPYEAVRLSRIADTDFDNHDVQISSDIISEWRNESSNEDFNNTVFLEQGNNDGILLIDIRENSIKYAFVNKNYTTIMNAEEYVAWDYDDANWKENFVKYGYVKAEDVEIFENNNKAISEMAVLMTEEEVKEFVNYDYLRDMNLY